ncbi:MAG: pyridoxine 5'-phosphate synthase [Verrucomicrobia bacterium]|nr:pyridoxine 5'-phosphate synthase [Verrucomicrobiota bacterium]
MIRLGVNVDHVATVRQARRATEPDPVAAAAIVELAGAHGITVHLREDRRHIQDRDVRILRETVRTSLNLEMAASDEIIGIAQGIRPDEACLVPERREEITTEGGLDVAGNTAKVADAIKRLNDTGILVSLFITPDEAQVAAAAKAGAQFIELHTGAYANARPEAKALGELQRLINAATQAHELGLRVNAGHGLDYINVRAMYQVPHLETVNIGHSIISRAVLVGLDRAVREMIALLERPA